jgi:hypothetical protein
VRTCRTYTTWDREARTAAELGIPIDATQYTVSDERGQVVAVIKTPLNVAYWARVSRRTTGPRFKTQVCRNTEARAELERYPALQFTVSARAAFN